MPFGYKLYFNDSYEITNLLKECFCKKEVDGAFAIGRLDSWAKKCALRECKGNYAFGLSQVRSKSFNAN